MYRRTNLRAYVLQCAMVLLGSLLVIVPSTAAYAQEDSAVYCSDLDDESCELVYDSQAVMAGLNSLSSEMGMEFMVSNIPDAPFDSLSIEMVQQTSYVMSDDAMDSLTAMKDLIQSEPTILRDNPEELFGLYMDLALETNEDTFVAFNLSDDLLTLFQEAIEEDEGPLPFDLPNEFALHIRVVDGTLFFNASMFSDMIPGITTIGDVWMGVGFDSVMGLALADTDFEELSDEEATQIAMLLSSSTGTANGPLLSTVASSPLMAQALPFLIVEREGDIEFDDRPTAVIRTTIDYTTLLADPVVQDFLANLLRNGDLMDEEFSEGDIEGILGMVQMAGPTVLDTLGLEMVEGIDIETGLMVGSEFALNWDISQLGPVMSMMGQEMPDAEDLPVVAINAYVNYAGHDADIEIGYPDTALIFSIEELMQMADLE